MTLTFNEARATIRALGYSITRREGAEYRVNCIGGSESSAYYTTDLDDAVGTARLEHQRSQPTQDAATVPLSTVKLLNEWAVNMGVALEYIATRTTASNDPAELHAFIAQLQSTARAAMVKL